jgi:hypothetical protein
METYSYRCVRFRRQLGLLVHVRCSSSASLSGRSAPAAAPPTKTSPTSRSATKTNPPPRDDPRRKRRPNERQDKKHGRGRDHGPRMGRHQGTEQPAAALVAVDLLRLHRLGGRLYHRSIPAWPLINGRPRACSASRPAPQVAGADRRGRRSRTPRSMPSWPAIDMTTRGHGRSLQTTPSNGGAAIFRANCSQCHGSGAAGRRRLSEPARRRLALGRHDRDIAYTITPRHPERRRLGRALLARCRPSATTASDEPKRSTAGGRSMCRSMSGQEHDALNGRRTGLETCSPRQLRRLPHGRGHRATRARARPT